MTRGFLPFLLIAVLAPRSAHGQRCVLRGQTSSPILVDIAPANTREEDRLSVSVVDTPLAIRPRRTSGFTVDVIGALRFTARATWLPLALTTSRTIADGIVRLTATTAITRVRGLGGGWGFDAIVGGELSLRGLWVPCDAVELIEERYSQSAGGGPPEARGYARLTRRQSVFRSRPGEGSAVVVRLLSSDLTFAVLGHRAGWTRLAWSASDGARVVGWVEDTVIRRVAGLTGSLVSSIVDRAGCEACAHIRLPGEFLGRARLHEAAEVFSAPDGTVWAHVGPSTTARVLRVGSDPWLRVLRFDGLSEDTGCEFRHAWIRADDVDLQSR